MQRFGILGTLLVVACGGHLDLGKDSGGDTGGSTGMQATGGTSGEGNATGEGAKSGTGAQPGTGGRLATGGSPSNPAGGSAPVGGRGSNTAARCAQTTPVAATGNWEGYSEDFLFKPVDKYRFDIAGVDEAGSLCGSVTFGDGEPLPPATDPDAAYPAGSDPIQQKGFATSLWPGAAYSITDGAERNGVVRFQVSAQELMSGWCALQTVYPVDMGYSCLPGNGFGVSYENGMAGACTAGNPGEEIETTAARCYQCAANCVCSESSCTSKMENLIVFDLTLSQDGNELSGTVGKTSLRLSRLP